MDFYGLGMHGMQGVSGSSPLGSILETPSTARGFSLLRTGRKGVKKTRIVAENSSKKTGGHLTPCISVFVGPFAQATITRLRFPFPPSQRFRCCIAQQARLEIHLPPQGQHRLLQGLERLDLPLPDRVAVTTPFGSDLHHGHLRLVEAKVITNEALLSRSQLR